MPIRPFPLQRTDGPPVTIPGGGERWTIGRGLDCDLVLPGQTVSRRHALLGFDEGAWITDLGSADGVRVNGLPTKRVALHDGDLVEIGPWQFVCRTGSGISLADTSPALQSSRLDLLLDLLAGLRLDDDEAGLCRPLVAAARGGTGYGRAAVIRLGGAPQLIAADPAHTDLDSLSHALIAAAAPGQVMRLRANEAVDFSASMVRERVHSALVAGIVVDGSLAACLYLDSRQEEAPEAPDVARFCLALAQVASSHLSALLSAQRLWNERERIYRDLHDDLGARLLGLIHRAPGSAVAGEARLMLRDLRDVVSVVDDELVALEVTLAEARAEVGDRCHGAGVALVLEPCEQGPVVMLSRAEATAIKRILREALTNALKHAEPRTIELRDTVDDTGCRISLTHDGNFHPPAEWAVGRGTRSIRQRAEELGGTANWLVSGHQLTFELFFPSETGHD